MNNNGNEFVRELNKATEYVNLMWRIRDYNPSPLYEFLQLTPQEPSSEKKDDIKNLCKSTKSHYGLWGICSYAYHNTHYVLSEQILKTINWCEANASAAISKEELLWEWMRRDERVRTLRKFAIRNCEKDLFFKALRLCDMHKNGYAKELFYKNRLATVAA